MIRLSIFILLISTLRITSQTNDINELRLAYIELQVKKNNTKSSQQKYFELFPNNFEKFKKTFGFEDGKAAPLYDGYDYIILFFSLDSMSIKKQVNKWIDISIKGEWEADAANYFQNELRKKVFNDVELFYVELIERPKTDIESFFYFFFDEIHPKFTSIPKEFEIFKKLDKEYYALIKKGHNKARVVREQ